MIAFQTAFYNGKCLVVQDVLYYRYNNADILFNQETLQFNVYFDKITCNKNVYENVNSPYETDI